MAKTTTHADYTATALTLTTAAQPNITSVGTLTSFRSTGIDDNADALAITIDSSERVGIGITSPSKKFVVSEGGAHGFEISPYDGSQNATRLINYNRNTSAYFPLEIEASQIGFEIDGTEKMRLDDSGNLYVGKTTGTSGNKIETDGRISAGAGSSGQPTFNCEGDTNTGINLPESDRIQLITGGSERMRIDSSGNVGIGTSSPANNLHIHTDSGSEGLTIKSTGDTSNAIIIDANRGSAGAAINQLLGKWNGTDVADILYLTGSDTTNKDDGIITFRTSSADDITERMRIDSSGNVGIATTAPSGKFHIEGGRAGIISTDSSWGQFRIANSGVGEVGLTFLNGGTSSEFLSDTDPSSSNKFIIGIHPYTCGTDTFGIASGALGDSIFHIDATGKFGFGAGSENPTHALEFINTSGQKIISFTNANSGTQPAGVGETGHSLLLHRPGIAFDRCWQYYPCITVLNDSTYSTNASTQGEFRVHGTDSNIANYPAAGGSDFGVDFRIDGSYLTGSDKRRKINITTISSALSKVKQLTGKRFQTINRKGEVEQNKSMADNYQFGFIAQEIESIIPETVKHHENEDDGTDNWNSAYALDYSSLTALLVNAIKEQDTVIQDLKSRIETLEG